MVGTAPNAADCVAYWKMEDLTDATGNGNTLINGGATSVSGVINNGFSMDGINDYLAASTVPVSGLPFSISFWEYIDTSITSAPHNVLGFCDASTNVVSFYLQTGKTPSNRINVLIDNAGSGVLFSYDVASSGWYHIVVVFDSGASYLYVNGVQRATSSASLSWDSNVDVFSIGALRDVSPFYVQGVFDEFAVFNVALTADNVTFLYNSGSPTSAQQYPFSGSPAVVVTPQQPFLSFGGI